MDVSKGVYVQYPKSDRLGWCFYFTAFLSLIPAVQAGITHTLSGPSTASVCDTLTLTNTVVNSGGVLSGLMVTNSLPGGNFTYVPGQTVMTLPGSVTRSGTNADPNSILNGTNLVWDFSNLASPCEVTHVLISEVYYNDSHTTMENKYGYQWVELFNPTVDPITLSGYKLWDAMPGVSDDLPTMTLAPGEFVIVAGSTNAFKSEHGSYTGQLFQVSDGAIGNGLNDYGDGVFLYQGTTQIDGMSYGNSTAAFPLPCQLTLAGYSLARYPAANADTGTRADWATLTDPTPGTGIIPTGLQSGKGVTIIYKVAGSCSAATGEFAANVGYQQPPGMPAPVSSASKSVTLYAGDLLVAETPLMQDAGRYDTVGWTVTVKNLGLGNAKNVVVTDHLSSGFQFVSSDQLPTSTNVSLGTVIIWDPTGVPALADLAPNDSVSIVMSGRVVSNVDLSNKADVQWGCTTSTVCQSSVTASNTITAGINLVDRVPRLAAWLTPASPVLVPYCSVTNVILHITNGADETVGSAFSVMVSNIWPVSVVGSSQIQVGDIPRGGSTNITIDLQAGGGCPIATNSQTAYFTFSYHDSMDRAYGPPTVYSVMQIVQPPSASVQVSVPAYQTSTAGGAIPVKLYFTYNNFAGTEQIMLRDTYPAYTNLALSDISEGGYTNGTDVVWTNSGFVGSGVYTASFNLVIGSLCGGPVGIIKNKVTVPNLMNCRGCEMSVVGSGEEYLTDLGAGSGCSTWSGGTGSCYYTSFKTTPTNLVEVCHPVFLSHSFTNFSGSLPGWTNMTFTSDLGGGGDLTGTNGVTVWVNGTNLTSFCTVSDIGSLLVNLSGLTNSPYPNIAMVTNEVVSEGVTNEVIVPGVTNLTITWWMQTLDPGRVEETSTLHMPVCGGASATVYWNVGASVMTAALQPIEYLEACGVTTGRIDLAQLPSPGLLSGSNAVFAAYDVRVTLNLDADGDQDSDLSYEANSTVFSNMVMWGGSTTNGFDPVILSNKLTWSLGNIDTKGGSSIFYVLRGACSRAALERQVAQVEYSSYCSSTQQLIAFSLTNPVPVVCPAGRLSVGIQPEVTFLTDTQYVVRLSFMNTGAGNAYNVTPELIIPTNVVFSSASIVPSAVTSTSVVWTLQYASNPGNLTDADGDGEKDDLIPLGQFEILVTNYITAFGQNAVHARVSHGCNNSTCQSAVSANATFESNAGALAARTSFAASGKLCNTNGAQILVLNTGLIKDFNIHIFEVLPEGMTYVVGSSRYVYGGVTNDALMDPTGVGTTGDKLNWGRDQIPILAGLPTGGQVTILFSTLAACAANTGNKQYSTSASYVDIGQNLNNVAAVSAVQTLVNPVLSVNVTALHTVVDHNRTNVYTITVDHSAGSTVDVPAMRLVDLMPTGVDYLGASVSPDFTNGQTLVWSNSTLMTLAPGGAPYTPGDAAISISVTGVVRTCNYIDNTATVYFGCDPDTLCLSAARTQTSISIPLVTVSDQSPLTLTSWGGTRTVVVTNEGATGRGIIISNIAPVGFVFTTDASVTGEFTGTPTVQLSGSPNGKFAIVDFNTTASSGGVVDGFDDAEDGSDNLDVGNGKGFVLTLNLINDGSGMDTLANPFDSGYVDPEPVVLSEVTAESVLTYSNLCVEISPVTVSQSSKTIPIRPDPDIDLLPHSLIVTNGQVVLFSLSVINAADAGFTTNLYVRLKFGAGWSNLSCLSTNIRNSGSGTLQMEILGSSNVLINLPGYALNPTDSEVAMTFQATAVQGAGPLYALAEVVGESPVAAAIPYVGTNTLGAAPLLNTMQGVHISTNSGTYYGFDQVEGLGAGFEVNGTISYAADGSPHVNQLTARIGEPLIFHLTANFFGTAYSNIVLTQSHEANLIFGTPVNYVYAGGITNAVYDDASGTFTLQPLLVDTDALSQFTVDVPVWVRNSLTNQAGISFTNVIIPTFTVVGVTNLPPNSTNIISLVEPTLALEMTCNTNNVQAGDVVTFTNVITHVDSTTNAYDIEFSNVLPDGMTFDDVAQGGTWTASGSVLNLTANEVPGLANLALGDSLTIVVNAKIMNQLVGSTISNVASIHYTSLPGEASYERNGSGGVGNLNDYTTSASVGVLAIPLTGVRKTAGTSSEPNTMLQNLTIGERILYTIHVDVPNGVSTNLQITDQLPPGLDWVGSNASADLAYPGYGYQFSIPLNGPVFSTNEGAGLTITDSDLTPGDSMTLDGSGKSVRFTMAVITNTPDGDVGNDHFDLTLQCVVLNDATNYNGKIWSNQVTVADGFSTNTTSSEAYTIVEPIVMIGHALSPVSGLDAGDMVTVTLFVTNSSAALADAFDVVVLDTLSLACFDPSTLVMETPESGWGITTNVVGGTNLEYRFFSLANTPLPVNTVVTNRFTVRLAQGISPNQVITNAVELLASDTINGTPPEGIPCRSTTSVKTYLSLTVTNVAIAKTFLGTSETNAADSVDQNVQVGETVSYRLAVTLPEGTISNLVVTDLIPRGMQYVTNRVNVSGFGGTLGSPMGLVSNGNSGAPVSFVFSNNTVVVTNNNTGDNTFLIDVDAVVLNTNINYGTSMGSRTFFTNSSIVSFAGNTLAVTNGSVVVTNIEPVIAISKIFSTNWMDAGDVVTVTLVVTNTGLATAFDLVVTDAVNTVYFDTNSSVASFTVNGLSPTGYVMRAINGGLLIVSDTINASAPTNSLEVNEGIVFRYTMVAAQTVPPNTSVSLAASFQADTMAGSTPAEQRILVAANAAALIAIPNMAVSKSLIGTSLNSDWESAATNLQIGETATYRINVMMPEGTISNLVVTDLIPAGMRYVAYRLVTPARMTLGTDSVTGGTGEGIPMVLTFAGNTVVENDNDPDNNTLGIDVDALVLDVPLNRGKVGQQTVFTNQATAVFSGPGSNTLTSSKVYAYAVEPSLRMIKTMSGPVDGVVTLSLMVTNEGLATAFDVVVTDRLDAAYFQTLSLANTLLPAGFTFASSGAPGSATITLASGDNSMLPTNAIKAGEAAVFKFTVLSVPNAGQNITNVAVIVSNSTLSGVSANERVEPVVCGTNMLALPMSAISKTVAYPVGRAADVGETVSYLIAVTNLGSLGMSSVLVTDVYPTNYLTYLNATSTPQTVLAGGTLVWSNVGPIAVGNGTNITVNFRASHSTYPGVMTNLVSSAVVTTNGASPAIINGSVVNTIVPSYALSKTVLFPVGRSAVTSGPAYFMMTVTNSGDLPLSTVQLSDTFDNGVLQFSSASPSPSTTNENSFAWNNVGTVPVGGTATVTGRFVALTSTGSGKTTNTVVSFVTYTNGLTTARTNEALLQVTIPVGLGVVISNPVPSGSNITFEINTISGAVYHVISVSNNIDHPSGQDWRLMVTWSNMPNWVTYTDTNVVAEVSNTRFYQIVWDEAGITQTNSVMYEAFVQNLTTGWWHELAMPVECFDYELDKTLGTKLKVGLRGDNADGDLLFALRQDGTWQTYRLYGDNKWVHDGETSETTDRISPNVGYWVKRLTGGVSTNIEYVGPVRLTSETNTFLPNTWKMISWPFPRSRAEDFGTNKGWGFAAAGAHGDINWENADRLYVSSGVTTIILYMRPNGRWYKVGQDVPAGNTVRLQHGVGYYYYHSGTGFVWAAESPAPGSAWY